MNITTKVTPTTVTVFPDRARVACVGECEVTAGQHKLQIPELPLTLQPDSVRVSGEGDTAVQILSVDVSRQFFEETPQEKVRQLEAQIEQLNDQLRQINDKKAGWEAHGRYLEGMRQATQAYAKGIAKGTSSVEEQLKVVTFLQEQDDAMRTAVHALDQEARQLQKRLDKLRKELAQQSKQRGRQLYMATVDIEVAGDGRFKPTITYVVNQASWQPLYDVRLTSNGTHPEIKITTLAEIRQRTGQAWQNVALAVSTARPALNQRLPELKPWHIDIVRPRIMAEPMAAASPQPATVRTMAKRDKPEAAVQLEAKPVEAEARVATVEDSGTAVTFKVPGGTDIPSDGTPHKTALAHHNLEPKMDYVAVPKHTDAVYRRATTINSSGAPWLAGQANLFVDDAFVGKTRIDFTAQRGELELLLGVEDGITIKRELVRRDVDKKLLRETRRIRFGYEIELENLLDTAVHVELKDHIPVSNHEELKVKLQHSNPTPTDITELNLMEWSLTLQPKQKQSVSYEFTVEHPRTLQVSRLP